jgi:hypothetical protein
MTVVEMAKPLSMGWCLDCHRDPEPNLRPRDQITNMAWDFERSTARPTTPQGSRPHAQVRPPEHCSGCHR